MWVALSPKGIATTAGSCNNGITEKKLKSKEHARQMKTAYRNQNVSPSTAFDVFDVFDEKTQGMLKAERPLLSLKNYFELLNYPSHNSQKDCSRSLIGLKSRKSKDNRAHWCLLIEGTYEWNKFRSPQQCGYVHVYLTSALRLPTTTVLWGNVSMPFSQRTTAA